MNNYDNFKHRVSLIPDVHQKQTYWIVITHLEKQYIWKILLIILNIIINDLIDFSCFWKVGSACDFCIILELFQVCLVKIIDCHAWKWRKTLYFIIFTSYSNVVYLRGMHTCTTVIECLRYAIPSHV